MRLRMIDDIMKANGRTAHCLPLDVGVVENQTDSASSVASIRDACNKIIHAKTMAFVPTATPHAQGLLYLAPEVQLFGTNNGKPWKITINIKEFVRAALHMVMT